MGIALALAQFVPSILGLFAGPKAAEVSQKVVDIAQAVTGKGTPDAALEALKADPNLVLQFQKSILEQKVELEKIAAQRAKDDAEADNTADALLTERMNKQEGTAEDLKGIPIIGPIMLFLRGSQRIVISYGTAYLDWEWLTGAIKVPAGGMEERMFFTASLLVFAVLFGERAIKNVAPLIADIFAARAGK